MKSLRQLGTEIRSTKGIKIGYVAALVLSIWAGIDLKRPLLITMPMTYAIATTTRFTYQQLSEKRQLYHLLGKYRVAIVQNSNLTDSNNTLQYQITEYQKATEDCKRMLVNYEDTQFRLTKTIQQRDELLGEVQELTDEITKLQRDYLYVKAQKDAIDNPLKDRIDDLKRSLQQQRTLLDEYETQMDELVVQNNQLQGQVITYRQLIEAMNAPKELPDTLDINKMANKLVRYFMDLKPPIAIDATDAKRRSDGDWEMTFHMHDSTEYARLLSYDTQIRVDMGLPSVPTIARLGTESMTVIIPRGDEVQYRSRVRWDNLWLKDAFITESGQVHHARFVGRTGSGKSELANNAVGMLMGEIPELYITLLDPLANSTTGWYRNPDAKGIQACLSSLKEFYSDMLRYEQEGTKPTDTRIIMIDEFDEFVKCEGVLAIVKAIWKRGRHSNRFCWVFGQTSLVGEFTSREAKLTLDDIQNTIGIYIANTIDRGIVDTYTDPQISAQLREDALTNAEKRICLVRPATAGRRPFIAQMPQPGTYTP